MPKGEVQIYKAINQSPFNFFQVLALIALLAAVIYTFLCFTLGFATKARSSTRYQSIKEKLSLRKVPILREGPYQYGSRHH